MGLLLYVAAYMSGALVTFGVYLGESNEKTFTEAALFMCLWPIFALIWIGVKIGRWAA